MVLPEKWRNLHPPIRHSKNELDLFFTCPHGLFAMVTSDSNPNASRYLQNRLELEGQMSGKGKKKFQEDEMNRADAWPLVGVGRREWA